MLIVHPSEFLKLMFQVLTLHQHYSFSETHPLYSLVLLSLWQLNSGHLLWQRLNLETSALETPLIKPNYLVIPITDALPQLSTPSCDHFGHQLAGRKYVWQLKFWHKSPINNQQIWKGRNLKNLLMFGQIIKCTIAILRKFFFVTILFSKVAIHLKATFEKGNLEPSNFLRNLPPLFMTWMHCLRHCDLMEGKGMTNKQFLGFIINLLIKLSLK